jgi:hypothetical protein
LQKKAKGQELLDKVFQHLELVEKDYFGLQFSDNGTPPVSSSDSMVGIAFKISFNLFIVIFSQIFETLWRFVNLR